MSQAHRPTWNPTMGRETKAGSQQISKWGLASHTKLKFRQPGQTSTGDVARRDLRAELAAAERAALDKKRKAQGLLPLASESEAVGAIENGSADEDAERAKRRRILEQALEDDADDSSDDSDEEDGKDGDDDDDDDDDSDDSDDEDDTAALMAELERIKKERAEEKARLDAEANAEAAADRDAEIATGNPLLNLQAALGQAPDTPASTTSSTFAVKRRWDDDLIFKNQAATGDKPKGDFVNDLLRSEFHKKFMQK